jgi:hypothetical protein
MGGVSLKMISCEADGEMERDEYLKATVHFATYDNTSGCNGTGWEI